MTKVINPIKQQDSSIKVKNDKATTPKNPPQNPPKKDDKDADFDNKGRRNSPF